MDKDFWLERWEKNEIGFHMSRPHLFLPRFFSRLQTTPGDAVFVPLCGRSPDLVWLHDAGLQVVGVELSRLAVDDFVSENALEAQWQTNTSLPCLSAENYRIYNGDLFALGFTDLCGARAVYDRAALVALPPEMRQSYAAHLSDILPGGARMLTIAYEYDQTESPGPPFAVPRTEIEALFGDNFSIELLIEEDTLAKHQGLAARGVTRLTEYAVLMVRL